MSRPYQGYPYVNPPVTPVHSSPVEEPKPAASARPYQGYPYVNPPVNDAPTVSPRTAKKWDHLPKKQLYPTPAPYNPSSQTSRKQGDADPEPVVYVDVPSENESPVYYSQSSRNTESTTSITNKRDIDENPVVYIDLPESSGSNVSLTQSRVPPRHQEQHNSSESKIDLDENPVVYIDFPESGGSVSVAQSRDNTPHNDEPSFVQHNSSESKIDLDENPVVYIDFPESGGSVSVVQSRDNTPHNDEPSFVQDTIFYDPFENRRIDEAKTPDTESNNTDSDEDASEASQPRPFNPVRRPNTLNLNAAGSSSGYAGPSNSTPAIMMKEAQIYQPELPTPIPASEFPDPPPAYAEIDRVSSPIVEGERPPERTIVILPGSNNVENDTTQTAANEASSPTTPNADQYNQNRKVMTCQYCGQRVQTLVVKENGIITHAFAVLCMVVCLIPAVACIYCTDYMKVTNHYCPHCNRVIGYQLPFTRNKIIYSD